MAMVRTTKLYARKSKQGRIFKWNTFFNNKLKQQTKCQSTHSTPSLFSRLAHPVGPIHYSKEYFHHLVPASISYHSAHVVSLVKPASVFITRYIPDKQHPMRYDSKRVPYERF